VAETAPDVKELLARAAMRQGSEEFRGAKAVKRFRAVFSSIYARDEKGNGQEFSTSTLAFALTAKVRTEMRLSGKTTVTGTTGKKFWIHRQDEKPLDFDPEEPKYAGDARDLESYARWLRLVLRVFFLGNLSESGPAVVQMPAEDFPVPGPDPKDKFAVVLRPVKCVRLDRARAEADKDPALRIYLDAATLDPVAAVILPERPDGPTRTLTFSYDVARRGEERLPAGKAIPKGLRLPFFLSLFETPPGPDAKPAFRISAALDDFAVCDATQLPDALFEMPKTK